MYQIKIMKQCASVSVTLGTDPSSIELQWKLCEWKQTDPNALSALRFCRLFYLSLIFRVVDKVSKMKLSATHIAPALIDEFYQVLIHLTNEEEFEIESGVLMLDITPSSTCMFIAKCLL